MTGRFSQTDIYREIFLTRDFLIVFTAGIAALATLFFTGPAVTAVLIVSAVVNGGPIIISSVKGLLKKRINVDELVALALIAALIHGDFFEAAVVAFVMRVGELIEEAVSGSARKDISALVKLTPDTVRLIREDQTVHSIPSDQLKAGNTVQILAGERIPADGIITQGKTSVDNSCMTGESLPVPRLEGEEVIAGSLNGEGSIHVRVTQCGADSRMGRIIQAVRAAESSRPEATRLVDRFARWFTPVILTAALLTFVLTKDADRAITVLITGCPCALVLIAPLGSLSASGRAASQGALIKGPRLIEKLHTADTLFFDKTGTLTHGTPRVLDILPVRGSAEDTMRLAFSLEQSSNHPLAAGICAWAKQNGLTGPAARDVTAAAGEGISGVLDSVLVSVRRESGTEKLDGHAREWLDGILEQGSSPVFVSRGGELTGIIAMGDTIRDESRGVAAWFKNKGIRTGMISGDHPKAVQKIAKLTGLNPAHPRQNPQQKARFLSDSPRSVFVGDGINDAVALTAAGVGIAMDNGEGLDAALESSDAVIIGGSLWKLPFLYRLSRRISLIMKTDIVFALTFNILAVTLGSAGIISPVAGAVLHNIGAIVVACSFVLGMGGLKAGELK